MDTFYNDHDARAAAWTRELMKDGHISQGVVDERSITELRGSELSGFRRVHLFSGICGWELALRLAGWPDEPVWTGSCPCQPFSAAGKRQGKADERHLWPEMLRLIRECHPATVFGEQVSSKLGREWLAGVFADLESLGYAVAGADLCAAGVGAPHIRQRLFWVADANKAGQSADGRPVRQERRDDLGRCGPHGSLADARSPERQRRPGEQGSGRQTPQRCEAMRQPGDDGEPGGMADANGGGCGTERQRRRLAKVHGRAAVERGEVAESGANFWTNAVLIPCRDGKARRAEPGIFPLAHGVPGRVGLLRGAGNAIVPQAAAAFIRAFLEARHQG